MLHQAVIPVHDQVALHDAERVENDTHQNQQRRAAEEGGEAAVQAAHVRYGRQDAHDAP